MTFSTDDLLDLAGIGVRGDEFIFELLDAGRNVIGTLDVEADQPPQIRNDTTRQVFRTCTGVQISATDLSAIDIFTERVRPSLVLQNGVRAPLGVYMFGQDDRTNFSWGQLFTPELFDEGFLVNQKLEAAIGTPPGGSILTLFLALLDPLNLPDISITVPDVATSTPLIYNAGTSRAAALAALATLLGCYPPFFNNAGTYTLKPAPAVDAPPDQIYEFGGRVIEGFTQTKSSLYKAPNRYIVLGADPSAGIVGSYDLPASAPNSYANTGRIVRNDFTSMQGIATQELADLAARLAFLTDRTPYSTASFSSTADPRHDTFDVVQLYGAQFVESAWTLTCSSGGVHTHELTETFV